MNDNGSSSIRLPLTARIDQSILYITLARPAVLKAELLQQHLIEARQNPGIRAIVITGKGHAFCAREDLKFAVQANLDTLGDSLFSFNCCAASMH